MRQSDSKEESNTTFINGGKMLAVLRT